MTRTKRWNWSKSGPWVKDCDMLNEDHSHTPQDIKARLEQGPDVSYLREWVYGGIDGVVTTFAVVAGVSGAALSPAIVLILGLANLVGDGFSMAAGCYSSTKTDSDNYERLRLAENRHIDQFPAGEKEEIRQIYAAKGFAGEDLDTIVRMISADREAWIEVMMEGEYGLAPVLKKPLSAAAHTFAAFALCGAMPLLPFLLGLPHAAVLALFLAALTFFAIGSFKSRWSVSAWWKHGFETMTIGLGAAGLAYLIGYGLKGLGL